MSLTVFEADYAVPWSFNFEQAPNDQIIMIAAKGVTEHDRIGFGYCSYGQVWIWDDQDSILPGWTLYAWAPTPKFPI